MNSSEKASSVASDSSPEGAHLSAIKKEKKEKKKEKKKHKKEKKLKSDASGSRVANNP